MTEETETNERRNACRIRGAARSCVVLHHMEAAVTGTALCGL
jgi:hypothetical protein